MPHVSKKSQVPRSGIHSNVDRKTSAQEDLARDDIDEAFAGDENEGRGHGVAHGTNLKSRATMKSKTRIPVR